MAESNADWISVACSAPLARLVIGTRLQCPLAHAARLFLHDMLPGWQYMPPTLQLPQGPLPLSLPKEWELSANLTVIDFPCKLQASQSKNKTVLPFHLASNCKLQAFSTMTPA